MVTMLDIFDELKEVTAKLEENEVEYALCGGLAMAVYGIPRATIDIDLLIQTKSLDKIKSLAKEKGYKLEADPMSFADSSIEIRRFTKIDPDSEDFLTLDLLLVTPPLKGVWETREKVEWEHGTLSVVSRKGLIALKTLRNSGQDIDDIKKLKGENQ